MSDIANTVDAVMIPESFRGSGSAFEISDRVATLAESLLGIDRGAAVVRHLPRGNYYCSRDAHDTILYPTGHSRAKRPRYRWETRADGVQLGYLLPDPAASQS